MNPDGTGKRNLTRNPADDTDYEGAPVWLPAVK
jgi:hypothetical protein